MRDRLYNLHYATAVGSAVFVLLSDIPLVKITTTFGVYIFTPKLIMLCMLTALTLTLHHHMHEGNKTGKFKSQLENSDHKSSPLSRSSSRKYKHQPITLQSKANSLSEKSTKRKTPIITLASYDSPEKSLTENGRLKFHPSSPLKNIPFQIESEKDQNTSPNISSSNLNQGRQKAKLTIEVNHAPFSPSPIQSPLIQVLSALSSPTKTIMQLPETIKTSIYKSTISNLVVYFVLFLSWTKCTLDLWNFSSFCQNNELFKFDNVLKWTNQYSLMCLSTYGFVITSVIETVILAFEVILISMTIENQSN